MRFRVLCSVFCFTVSIVITAVAQFGSPNPGLREMPPGMSPDRGNTVITGTVYGDDGVAMAGVRVDARDPANNMVVSFATTRSDGSFEMYNIPAGSYELVAQAQGSEARELVPEGRSVNRVDLRFGHAAAGAEQGESAVSLYRLKVPGKARDRYLKAVQCFASGKFEQAQKAVDQALAIYANYPDALTLRGLLAWRSRDADVAMQSFQKSIELDPNYEPAYTAMSSVLNSQGKYDDAARTTERAVGLNPNAWQGYFEWSKAMLGKGLYQKALQLANRAQSLAPNGVAGVHLLKAYALVPMNLYKDAANELQAFLSHAPRGQDVSSVKVLLARVQAAAAQGAGAAPAGLALVNH